MISLVKVESQLMQAGISRLPPVEQWNPPFSGDIDICIKSNGDWYHEGQKFTRHALVKLFSSILKKEGDNYFLVTPKEKWRIRVEEKPFLVVDCDIQIFESDPTKNKIRFTTRTDDIFFLDKSHPLIINTQPISGAPRPYVLVRGMLEALVNRNVFYKLVDFATVLNGEYGVWSCGIFFKME